MKKSITFSNEYNHPVQKVWTALTTEKAISEWLMPAQDFALIVGQKFKLSTDKAPGFDGIVHCEILEIIENRLLSYSWKAGKLDTVVTFKLKEKNGGTILDFEHKGFERIMDRLLVRNFLARGWKTKILPILLSKYLSK